MKSDFNKYLDALNEITNREKLERFYTTHSATIQFFRAIDKSVQEALCKPTVDVVFLKQLETALPILINLEKEITFLDPKLSMSYKNKIEQAIDYIASEMSISEVNDTYKQLLDLLSKNKQAFIDEEKEEQRKRKEQEILEQEQRKAQEQKDRYNKLLQEYKNASTEQEYLTLAVQFRTMNGYENTTELADECANQHRVLKEAREEQERMRVEQERKDKYNRLVQEKNNASTESEFQNLAKEFRAMNGYENTEELAKECDSALKYIKEEQKRQTTYNKLVQAKNEISKKEEFQYLAKQFREMNGYKDTEELAKECEIRCKEIEVKIRKKKTIKAISWSVFLVIILTLVYGFFNGWFDN